MVAVTKYYGYVRDKKNLSEEEEYAEMANFRAEKSEPWSMVFGGQSNNDAYGVGGIPHWVVLDRDGNVAFIHIGYTAEIFVPFREKVKALVEGTD